MRWGGATVSLSPNQRHIIIFWTSQPGITTGTPLLCSVSVWASWWVIDSRIWVFWWTGGMDSKGRWNAQKERRLLEWICAHPVARVFSQMCLLPGTWRASCRISAKFIYSRKHSRCVVPERCGFDFQREPRSRVFCLFVLIWLKGLRTRVWTNTREIATTVL